LGDINILKRQNDLVGWTNTQIQLNSGSKESSTAKIII